MHAHAVIIPAARAHHITTQAGTSCGVRPNTLGSHPHQLIDGTCLCVLTSNHLRSAACVLGGGIRAKSDLDTSRQARARSLGLSRSLSVSLSLSQSLSVRPRTHACRAALCYAAPCAVSPGGTHCHKKHESRQFSETVQRKSVQLKLDTMRNPVRNAIAIQNSVQKKTVQRKFQALYANLIQNKSMQQLQSTGSP